MESKTSESTQITKSLLKEIHHRHLMNGESNDVHKEAIILALGGTNQIISYLLESNAPLNQKHLNSLHHIISTPHHQTQINGKTCTNKSNALTFNDDDILYYSIFRKQTAANIINILNSKITKIILAMVLLICTATLLLFIANIASYYVFIAVFSALSFMFFMYSFGWIVYANKIVMKLLLMEFEFWFKIIYLIQYLVADAALQYIKDDPIHFICTSFLLDASFLFLVTIFDAINIKQSSKILISCFGVGSFAHNALVYSQTSFYRNDIYEQSTVIIPDFVGFGSLSYNLVDIAANSGLILAIFLMKQMVSSIMKPQQSSVITIKPLMIYENKKENMVRIETVTKWKRAAVSYWILMLLLFIGYLVISSEGNMYIIIMVIINLFSAFIVVCLLMTPKIKCLCGANTAIFMNVVINVIAIYLIKWDVRPIGWIGIGFALSIIYALNAIKLEQQLGEGKHCKSDTQQQTEKETQAIYIEDTMDEIELQTDHHIDHNHQDTIDSASAAN